MCDGEDWERSRHDRIKIAFGHVRTELPLRYPRGAISKMGVKEISPSESRTRDATQELRACSWCGQWPGTLQGNQESVGSH